MNEHDDEIVTDQMFKRHMAAMMASQAAVVLVLLNMVAEMAEVEPQEIMDRARQEEKEMLKHLTEELERGPRNEQPPQSEEDEG